MCIRDSYVGGYFTQAGEQNANGSAKWCPNSQEWSSMNADLSRYNNISNIEIDAPGNIYSSKRGYNSSTNQVVYGIDVWNSTTEEWNSVGSGLNNSIRDIEIGPSGNIYAGGSFTQAGGQSVNHIAKFQVCQDEVVITCELPDGNYSAATLIQSTTNVVDGDDVEMSAPTILLNPGFTVFAGSQYEANNEGCNE